MMQMTLPSSLNMKGSSSSRITKWRIDAFLCSAFLLLCIVAVHPGVDIGMIDDFSYFKSAQVLASTGHIVYNGWAAAMLGWQLYIGALFIKLFGASYTAVRASTTIIALVMVFLVQRIYVRLGINSWNASMGTLTLVACPLFMPLSVSFMSDIDGLFCIVLCLYACLRALQAPANRSTLGWLVFAAVTGAVGGTVRQSSWVGVLVIFPCTVWLLRRRPHVLLLGGALYAVSLAFVFASMNWFLRQPYVIFDGLPTRLRPGIVSHALSQSFGAIFTVVMFLLPILAAFAFALFLSRSWNYRWLALGGIGIGIGIAIVATQYQVDHLLVPFLAGYISRYGPAASAPLLGESPVILEHGTRLVVSGGTYGLLFCFLIWLHLVFRRSPEFAKDAREVYSEPRSLPWLSLLIFIVPVTLSYFALLIPIAMAHAIFDRYVFPLLFFAIPILLRLYQERAGARLPAACYVLILLFAAYSIATTHDIFSAYRARLAAINEMEAAGVPATSIYASFDFDGMTQIEAAGYMNDERIRVPRTAFHPVVMSPPAGCTSMMMLDKTPVVHPEYALSFDPYACGGSSTFPAVTYSNWLGPRTLNIYIVRTSKPS